MLTEVLICGKLFKIVESKDTQGAEFYYDDKLIKIGIYKDKHKLLEILTHEISEIIHILLGHRLCKTENSSYIFVLDHAGFQTHHEILIDTLMNNKILKIK